MGKSYCPGWSQTVAEGNFWAKTPAYLCGNQPVSQARHLGAAAFDFSLVATVPTLVVPSAE